MTTDGDYGLELWRAGEDLERPGAQGGAFILADDMEGLWVIVDV